MSPTSTAANQGPATDPSPDSSASPALRGRRREADDRRDELLAAARAIALRDGLDAVGAVDVARAGGASKALVFHYFGSTVQLRRAVAATAIEALGDALADEAPAPAPSTSPVPDGPDGGTSPEPSPASPGPAARAEVVRRVLETVTADRRIWTDIWAGALRGDAPTDEGLDAVRAQLFRRVARRVGAPLPDAPASPRLELLAAGWVAFVETVISRWLAGADADSTTVEQLVLGSLDALLAAGPGSTHQG